jgi:hypothetical protein
MGEVGPNGPVPFKSPLIYDPYKRYEAWRFLSYMLIHAGYNNPNISYNDLPSFDSTIIDSSISVLIFWCKWFSVFHWKWSTLGGESSSSTWLV